MLKEFIRWRDEERILYAATWIAIALLLASLVGLVVDHRQILGLNPWIKPIKFDVSTIVFFITVAAITSSLEGAPRLTSFIGTGTGFAMVAEDVLISLQSLRGVRSHMNYDTPFDGTLFTVMGTLVVVNTALLAVLMILCFKLRSRWPPAVNLGAALGLFAIVMGSFEGVYMVLSGAHTVGGADGSAGLNFVNWSTRYGDLRIAHFFALHALQVVPLAGFLISRTRWPQRVQTVAVFGVFAAYMGTVFLLFRQAQAGHPLLG